MLARILEAAIVTGQSALVRCLPLRARANGRHLLIVSHDFPPAAVTATQLPAFLARHAAQRGWKVSVACGARPLAPSPRGEAALADLPPAVRIVRAPGHFDQSGEYYPRYPYRFSGQIDGGYAQQVGMTYAAVSALRRDPPSHIFATGPTFNNFAAARILARRFRVPLVLQYRDEWTVNPPTFVDAGDTTRALESQCLRDAALVTFVTVGKLAAYREAFPHLDRTRALILPNGWDPALASASGRSTQHLAALRDRFVLTFTGRITAETPIEPLLEQLAIVLEEDEALRARFVLCVAGDQRADGRASLEAFGRRFPGSVHLLPPVTQVVAHEIQRESTVLLLLNNTRYAGVVPLKTFDYMIAGPPILAFGTAGEAGEIVQETGAGLTVAEGDPAALRAALATLQAMPASHWNPPSRLAWNTAHNRATLNDILLDTIAGLTPRA